MSRGIGRLQTAILDLLKERSPGSFLTTGLLARKLHRPPQQVYRALRSLAERELVELTLEPTLRVWLPGTTERRRSYWRSIEAKYAAQQLRRPPHCGPGCQENHVGSDKTHYA